MIDKIKKYKKLELWIFAVLGMGVIYPTPISNDRFGQPFLNVLINALLVLTLFYFIEVRHLVKIYFIDYFFGLIFSILYNFTSLFIAGEKPYTIMGTYYLHGIGNILITILAILGWTITFAGALALCSFGCQKYSNYSEKAFFKFKSVFLVILISWSLVIVFFLPGQVSWDALKQFCEFEGKRVANLEFTYIPTNHNPWFVTLIIGNIFNVGNKLLNPNFGVFLVILFQTLISAFIYTKVVQFVGQKSGKIMGIISLVIFASPIFSSYAVTIDKSTLYYAFCAAFYLCYVKIIVGVKNKHKALHTNDYLLYLLTMLLFSQFRNDALYISIISTLILLVFLVYKHMNITRLLFVLLAFAAIICSWKAYMQKNNIISGASSEALTIPTRQISYVYLNSPSDLTKKDKQIINKITPLNEIKKNYDINSGDNLKNLFPVNTFLNNPSIIKDVVHGEKKIRSNLKIKNDLRNYLKVWLKVGIKHPFTYIKVYIAANSFYLNPFVCSPNLYGSLFINFPTRVPYYVEPSWVDKYNYLFKDSVRLKAREFIGLILSFPLIAFFLNTATATWLLIYLLYRSIKIKSLDLFIILVPLIGLVALSTLVPINGYSRYVIGEIAIVLIAFACMFSAGRINIKK